MRFSVTCDGEACGCPAGHDDGETVELPPLEDLAESTGFPVDALEALDDDQLAVIAEALATVEDEAETEAAENAALAAMGVVTRPPDPAADGVLPPAVLNRLDADTPTLENGEASAILTAPPDGAREADGEVPPAIVSRKRSGRLPDGSVPPRIATRPAAPVEE